MERRKFIQTAGVAGAVSLGASAAGEKHGMKVMADGKELYEIRTYELRFRGNQKLLVDYLKGALHPAMKRLGVNHFMIFTEIGNTLPKKIRVVISYPGIDSYLKSQNLYMDKDYVKAASEYDSLPVDNPIYTRFSSSLLHAFDGLPKMEKPVEGATVFELRTYEGFSEDAVRRKIKMFNDEEFPLFREVGLNPVFFGEVIAGPLRPCLTYMLNYKDMDAHGKAWKAFLDAPAWNEMKVKPEYANTVSNIRNQFLELI